MQDPDANLHAAEALELKVRRFHSKWLLTCCDLLAYGIAIGVPWVIGVWWLSEAVLFYLNFN